MAKSRTVTLEGDTFTVIETENGKETRWRISPEGLAAQRAEFEGDMTAPQKVRCDEVMKVAEDAKLALVRTGAKR